MTQTEKSIVYGISAYSWQGEEVKKVGIDCATVGSRSLENYDTIIVYPGSFENIKSPDIRSQEVIVRAKDIRNALKGGSHVCILNSEKNDPLISELYFLFSFKRIKPVKEIQEVYTKRSEFDIFIRNNGIAFGIFSYRDSMSVICTVTNVYVSNEEPEPEVTAYNDEFVVGFSSRIEKGLLTILPFYTPKWSSSKSMGEGMPQLVESLDTHKKNIIFEPPSWISQVKTQEELDLDKELSEFNKKIEKAEIKLKECMNLKSVLWLKHNELRDACVKVFEEFGFKVIVEDIGEEDFWIMENSSVSIICECKGLDKNLERTDLSKFDEHREARNKDEKFPGVLIVNSFNKAQTLKSKDIPIPSNVIQKAISSNFLVIRTLDLIRLLDLFKRRIISRENISQIFKTECGWLKVEDNPQVIKK